MTIIKKILHPIWGEINHRDDNEEWELSEVHTWKKVGDIEIRFYIGDVESKIVHENFISIKQQWSKIWSHIISRIEWLIKAYNEDINGINPANDFFYLRLPVESINENGGWSVMLQSEIGWLLDFEGWENDGGQGVF